MSVCCGVECVVVIGFTRWLWKRCTYIGSNDSATWPLATPEEFSPIPRICRLILAVYEPDLHRPLHPPSPHGYGLDPNLVIKRVTYQQTLGHAPPYLIYADHPNREIVVAIRGLNLAKESDYKLLLDNRLGRQMFDGGYVHHGLLKSAIWVLNHESETLKSVWVSTGKCYRMVFAGHSLGSGVAALLAIIVVNHRDKLGGIPRGLVRSYALAPARCMSLNLAVKYADVIHSVILQDDFLPRTATPLEDIFKSVFCLPCLIFLICLRDTFVPEDRKLRDPRRLYAPGRMYHIVERKFCRCGRFPPQVRTAIPVEGRFEHIVLSCHATSDHGILWIEREAEKALQRMKEDYGDGDGGASAAVMSPPRVQRIHRLQTIEKEHKDALERAVSLNVPHAVPVKEDEEEEEDVEVQCDAPKERKPAEESSSSSTQLKSGVGRTNWNDLVAKLFKKAEHGELLLKKDTEDDPN
ncbi:hypothetical protein vseg_021258 [Gypsophila vaccaria]